MTRPMTPHYSGKISEEFWRRINALPDAQRGEAYALGVVLQNVESDVLRMISSLEAAVREKASRPIPSPAPAPPPTEPASSGPRFLRLKQVMHRVGLSRATIYLWMRQGRFPKPVDLGAGGAVAWPEADIDKWIADTINAARR